MANNQFDVLVIGSGIGGMCAAAYLAHKGYKTLVTEALPRIGGHCSTIEYKGIKCTTGVLGPGLGGPLEALFREVGAEYNVRPCGTPHYLINGKIMELPPKGGLKTLLSAAARKPDDVEPVLQAFAKEMSSADASPTMSLRQWILQFTRDKGILELFQTMTAATAIVDIDNISARGFFLFLRQLRGFREWGVCPEGSIALPNALAKVIEKNNGAIWTGAPAVRIHLENNVARGATIIKDDREVNVQASVVISNCGPARTVNLVGSDKLDKEYLEELKKLTPARAISIHIKSDVPLMDHDHLLIVGARRIIALFQLTSICPELAPPGTHYLVAAADPLSSLTPSEAKKEIDLSLEDVRDLLPGFDAHAEILMTGCYHGNWPAMFSIAGQSMSPKTPIENLYAVGDGFIAEAGMTAMVGAAGSGVAAAKEIAMDLKPRG
jgi:phytoene dehydrogenase-like protein